MEYQTKEMRPTKQAKPTAKQKFVIEVTNRKTGNSWSLTTSDRDMAQEIIDSIDYKSKPVFINKPNQILIKLEV